MICPICFSNLIFIPFLHLFQSHRLSSRMPVYLFGGSLHLLSPPPDAHIPHTAHSLSLPRILFARSSLQWHHPRPKWPQALVPPLAFFWLHVLLLFLHSFATTSIVPYNHYLFLSFLSHKNVRPKMEGTLLPSSSLYPQSLEEWLAHGRNSRNIYGISE